MLRRMLDARPLVALIVAAGMGFRYLPGWWAYFAGALILLALVFLPSFSRSFPPILQIVLRGGSNLFFTILGVSPSAL